MSRKESLLYEASDIKLLIPQVQEAGEIIPTASTTTQLAIGDALAITTMNYKKFGKVDFKKLHPSGSLGSQLITVSDIMVQGKKIPFVNENIKMINALKILSKKKLGVLIAQNKYKKTTGIITDGQIRRFNVKQNNINELKVKDLMTSNPISINKNQLAAKALALMNEKKITSLCVHDNTKKTNTIGVVHIHDILQSNIS